MKSKYKILIIVLLGSILTGLFIYKNYNIDTKSGEIAIIKKDKYDASEEIKKATKLLGSGKKAEVITNANTAGNIVALSFEGLANKDTMDKIINMLDSYGIKATFFIPGIKAAEDSSVVEEIQKGGHDIENGTLSWSKNMQNLSTNQLVTDFCKSNKIIKSITGKDTMLLKCNSTTYGNNILTAAYASGNKYVVSNTRYLSYQSFKNYEESSEYMENLEKGSIISIKLEGVLDNFEYGKTELEEKPAIDKKAGINEKSNKENKEVNIVQIVDWTLKSIKEKNKTVVRIYELPNIIKNSRLSSKTNIIDGLNEKYGNMYKFIKVPNEKRDNESLAINDIPKNEIESEIESQSENEIEIELKNKVNLISFKDLIKKNHGKLAPVVSEFYTTKNSLSYTFRGLSNEYILDNVLMALKNVNAKGTFFVTKEEILKYPDRINKILNLGHEIGNGGITNGSKLLSKSTEEICKEIYEVDTLLRSMEINSNAYMPGSGNVDLEIREALSAMTNKVPFKNYELFTYSKSPIVSKYKDMSAEEVVKKYFNIESYLSLKKGEIVYFKLDSDLFESNNTVANIVEVLTKNYVESGYAYKLNEKSQKYDLIQIPLGYSLVTLGDLQNIFETSSNFGRYNIKSNLSSMEKKTYEEALRMFKTNYIGNKNVDLSGFGEDERLSIDKYGTIDTKGENVVFLSFDDWGGDPIVNEILDVLDKHRVKADFFVISKYIDINSGISNANPNLLRTIALKGHDIGSHSYNHELLDASREKLEDSLIKSYDVMKNVVGDLDSLKPYFRPPTLLVKREGLAAVFESGYKYSISGNISTRDYERTSPQEIVSNIESELVQGKGNIVIMHMNNQSYHTPKALDIFLSNNEKGLYGVKYKIAKLSDYLEK